MSQGFRAAFVMRASTHRLLSVTVVALFAGVALSGCTSVRDKQELGAAFVKRSCLEKTQRVATAIGPPAAAPLSLPSVAVAPVVPGALVQGTQEMVIGTLLPSAAVASRADMVRAADLAAEQANAANALRIRLIHSDAASASADALGALASQGAVVVVASPITGELLDEAAQRKVVVFGPTATDPSLSLERRNDGYFYRIPPSTALEGETLADLVWKEGCRTVGVLADGDANGRGVAARFRSALEDKGGTVSELVLVTGTPTGGQVQQVARNDPDAVLLVMGAQAGAEAIKSAFDLGKMKRSVWYFSGSLRSDAFVQAVGKEENTETKRSEFVVSGLRGASPEATTGPALDAFRSDYRAAYPEDADGPGPWAAETYDAVMIAALAGSATIRSQELRGEFVRDHVREVANRDSSSDVPVRGSSIRNGILLAATGTNVDYQGASGDGDFDAYGDPKSGFYAWWKVNEDGSLTTTRSKVEPGKPPP
ncbi:MAG TPA: penicillin-binding protein activator [Candidatus Thermoplasmatota archaeon]|nr:penicillin-binding protein activator [Candidatus Thermoplasmatota archaeon]